MLRAAAATAVALVAAGTTLVGAAPAANDPVTCAGTRVDGGWQSLTVGRLPDGTVPTGMAVDPNSTTRVVVWNSSGIVLTADQGCTWATPMLGLGAGETVAFVTVSQEVVQVVTRTGPAAAAPTRVHLVDLGAGTVKDGGDDLPAAGEPVAAAASRRGGDVVVAVAPQTPVGVPVPDPLDLPGTGPAVPTGDTSRAVQVSADAGLSYAGTTRGTDLGNAAVTGVVVDDAAPDGLDVLAGGIVYLSEDRGTTVTKTSLHGVTLVAPLLGGGTVAFGSGGASLVTDAPHTSDDGGSGYRIAPKNAPAGVVAAASRAGDVGHLLLSDGTHLLLWNLGNGTAQDVTPTSLVGGGVVALDGDLSTTASTFVALTKDGHLLRQIQPAAPVRQQQAAPDQGVAGGVGTLADAGSPTLLPSATAVRLGSGEAADVLLTLALPPSPTPVDLYFLVDTSESGLGAVDDLKRDAARVVSTLRGQGVQLQVGIAAVDSVLADGSEEPALEPLQTGYQRPVAYRQLARVGSPEAFLDALAELARDTPAQNGPRRVQPQAAGIWQALTGSGIRSADGLSWDVQPGQPAGWRDGNVRHILIDATDSGFEEPGDKNAPGYREPRGTQLADGVVDQDLLARTMVAQQVLHVGTLYTADPEALAQLGELSRRTGALAGPAGVACSGSRLAAGQPLTCTARDTLTDVVLSAVDSLRDLQQVGASATRDDGVVTAVRDDSSGSVDALVRNEVHVTVSVRCPVADAASTHPETVTASFRQAAVATAGLTVECGTDPAPAVVLPPVAPAPAPAAAPGNPPPAPVAPAPAVQVQAQPQAQTQAQVQAQTQAQAQVAAAEREEAQQALAFAMAGLDEEGNTSFAMAGTPSLRSRQDDDEQAAALAVGLSAAALSAAWSAAGVRRRRQGAALTLPAGGTVDYPGG